jgi:DNA-binding transcriptional ArsR family regulator
VTVVDERATDEALRAIAEPRRREILRLVAHDELAAGEIAAAFDVTRTAVSQHLTVLKSAGLLVERRDGTRRLYRARPEGLAGLREFLDEMWASSWTSPAGSSRPSGGSPMRIRPRPPADRPDDPPAARGARVRAEASWALVLRRFTEHIHDRGQEDDDDDRIR